MSKSILFIISSILLIEIIYCVEYCNEKFLFNYEGEDEDAMGFTYGHLRKVWHHADSCNSLPVKDTSKYSCCYIHVEFRSLIDGERYDQYGCIDMTNPWEDYGGSQDNVTNTSNYIRDKVGGFQYVDADKNLHVKILCSANFLKLSLLSLLVLILF